MKIIIGTMFTEVDFEGNSLLQEKVHGAVHNEVKFGGMAVKVDGAFHSRAFKSGYWDGLTDFYNFKEDKFHTGLLQQFLAAMRELQKVDPNITYEVEDERPAPMVSAGSIDAEIVLGNGDEDDIILRDYQYDSVYKAFEEQVGIINVATNGGKTEIASGIMQQALPYLKRGERIVFFTHSKEIMGQSAERIAKRLNMPISKIGKMGDGKFDIKNKQLVFVMIPTLISALKDPKKGVKFTSKENVIKFIAEEIYPKFRNTANTRQLMRNYIKNCKLTTKIWENAQLQLEYIAYDNKFTDKKAQMELNKYVVEFEKIMQKKNKDKYKKYKETMDFMESIRVMIADEVHHSKSDTWYSSLSLCSNATYRIGLTGTVDKKDEMGWERLQAVFSHIIVKVSNDFLIDRGISSKPTIRLVPIQEPRNIEIVGTFMEAYKLGIVENDVRNQTIANLAVAYKKQRPGGILISVKEIEHGERIMKLIQEKGITSIAFIHGSSEDEHRSGMLEAFSKGQLDILIASTIIDEGVDMKSIGCMILAAGGKSLRQQLQRIGRGLRLNGIDGNSVMVFDFFDATNKYLLEHSKQRIKIFKEEKFDVKVLGK
jgi:superfamily II DNA or RNA helicase